MTGNILTDFIIKTFYCECDKGEICADKKEMLEILRNSDLSFRDMLFNYRRWKRTGKIFCPVCNGVGSFEKII